MAAIQSPLHDNNQQSPSPLSFTEEEDERVPTPSQRVATPATRRSVRDSTATMSDSFVEWFDAEDEGPEEFILDVTNAVSEPPSRMLSVVNDISADNSSIDTEYEEALAQSVSPTRDQMAVTGQIQVIRRTQLPTLPPADEGSLFAILKKNVGKVRVEYNIYYSSR